MGDTMTRFPSASDAVSALRSPDGTSRGHWIDHGSVTDFQVNAKEFLRGDGSTEDAAQVALLQASASGKRCYWPPGTYLLPNGTGFTLASGSEHHGAGRSKTTISVKDAYAFLGTSLTGIKLDGFNVAVRSGATVGGAVKSVSSSNNNWTLRHIYADNVGTNANAAFWLQGWIGNHAIDCSGVNGQLGFYLDSTGFANSNSLFRCRAASNSVAGMRVTGEGNCVTESIVESNTGYGIELVDSFTAVISGVHFEDCKQHAIYSRGDSANSFLVGNAFWSYMAGAAAGTRFVYLAATGGHNSTNTNVIGNQFYNQTTMLEIAAGVNNATVAWNAGLRLDDSSVVDAGTNTTFLAAEAGQKLPAQNTQGYFRMVGPAVPSVSVPMLSGSGNNGHNGFWVTEGGYPVFKTTDGDPGTGGVLQNSNFAFYVDAADSYKIKVRVRKADGSYLTGTVVTPT